MNKFLVLSDLEKVERIRNFRSAKNRFLETDMRRQLIYETYFAIFFQNNNTKSLTRKINTLSLSALFMQFSFEKTLTTWAWKAQNEKPKFHKFASSKNLLSSVCKFIFKGQFTWILLFHHYTPSENLCGKKFPNRPSKICGNRPLRN